MPRTPRTTQRPGPLQELPLAYFIPSNDAAHGNPLQSGSKRLRNPGASVLLSPVKKRLLREDRLYPSLEPSASPRRTRSSEQTLNGNLSPARRLDFSSLKAGGVPSLEILNDHSSSRHHKQSTSSYKTLPSSANLSSCDAAQSCTYPEATNSSIHCASDCRILAPAPILIPREVPPSPNRQSVDYPGFDVYRDTHIELITTSSRFRMDDSEDLDTDFVKENIPPRIRPKKVMSAPEKIGPMPFSPKGKSKLSAASFPVTPQEFYRETPATPRVNRTPGLNACSMTPGWTPRAGNSLSSRRALEREVDERCSEDDPSLDVTL